MALEELNDYTTLSRFTGLNPIRWLFEVERFFSLYAIYDEEERFTYVVEYFEDEAFSWFNSWYRGPERLTWNSFTAAMLTTFPPVPKPPPNHTPSPEPFAPPPSPQPTRQTYTTNLPEPKPPITTPPPCTKPVTLLSTTVPKLTHNTAVRLQWRPPWQPVTTAPYATGRVEWITDKHDNTMVTLLTDSNIHTEVFTDSNNMVTLLSVSNTNTTITDIAETTNEVVTNFTNIIPDVTTQTPSLLNYFSGHKCKPPAYVFLQTETEPPWKPRHTWYKDMSLEDKARFQAWGIDTCTRDQVMGNLPLMRI